MPAMQNFASNSNSTTTHCSGNFILFASLGSKQAAEGLLELCIFFQLVQNGWLERVLPDWRGSYVVVMIDSSASNNTLILEPCGVHSRVRFH